jgi:hypothetical protein
MFAWLGELGGKIVGQKIATEGLTLFGRKIAADTCTKVAGGAMVACAAKGALDIISPDSPSYPSYRAQNFRG